MRSQQSDRFSFMLIDIAARNLFLGRGSRRETVLYERYERGRLSSSKIFNAGASPETDVEIRCCLAGWGGVSAEFSMEYCGANSVAFMYKIDSACTTVFPLHFLVQGLDFHGMQGG